MRVLVTGARGHLGRHLVERLALAGFTVTAQVRASAPTYAFAPAHIARGDLADPAVVARCLANVDAVVHCAARVRGGTGADYHRDNVQATQNLSRQAAALGVSRFVHISTIAVYGKRAHRLTAEDAPLQGDDLYAETKIEAEHQVLSAAPEPVILRPGVLWGGPHDAGRVGKLAARLATRTCFFPGPCDAPGPLTHVDNLGDAALLALDARGLQSRVFNITDDPPVSLREFATRLAAARGLPAPGLALPKRWVLAGVGLVQDFRDRFAPRMPMAIRRDTVELMNAECTFSLAAARAQLGYRPVPREFMA